MYHDPREKAILYRLTFRDLCPRALLRYGLYNYANQRVAIASLSSGSPPGSLHLCAQLRRASIVISRVPGNLNRMEVHKRQCRQSDKAGGLERDNRYKVSLRSKHLSLPLLTHSCPSRMNVSEQCKAAVRITWAPRLIICMV
jgi:hypothetical protein